MTVLVLERVTPSLRGEISKWLIEIKAGVFVGRISGLVRDQLWDRCVNRLDEGCAIQIWSTNNEQGFDLRYAGESERVPIDIEGLWLIRTPP